MELDHRIATGQFPGVFHGAGYNCRFVDGTHTYSQHAFWNALDVQAKVFSQFMTVLKPVRDWIVGPWASQPKYPGSPLFYTHPVMHGDAVTQVKNELKRRHLNNPPMDGTDLFGSAADANVRKFQFAQHLVTDGVVGPRTWAALFPLS